MLFDKLCGFAEKSGRKYLLDLLNRAAIFQVNREESVPEMQSISKDVDEFRSRFFLTLDPMWIETATEGVLFSSTQSNEILEAVQEHHPNPHGVKFENPLYMICVGRTTKRGEYICFVGFSVFNEGADGKPHWMSAVQAAGRFDEKGRGELYLLDELPGVERQRDNITMSLQDISGSGLAGMILANSPRSFVFTKEYIHARTVIRGKVPRSDQRLRYIIVSDKDVERVLRIPNPENKDTVSPHRRRAHTKLLKSEKFTWKRGERVFVKACWVGPESAEYGGERYTVCLDL